MADWIKCVNEDCQYFVEHGEYHEVCKDQKIKKIVTNADHIRSMSDEELAEFLAETELHGSQGKYEDYLKWLQSEAE